MPFLVTELNDHIEKEEHHYWYAFNDNRNHPNFQLAISYLTGQTSTLQGLQAANENYYLAVYVSLLQNPAAPTEKENLLASLLFHPDIFNYVQHYLFHWFVQCLVSNDNEETLKAGLTLFRNAGLSDTEIQQAILHYMQHIPDVMVVFENKDSALKRFLIQHLSANIGNRLQQYSMHLYGNWNYCYFLLLEEAQPQLVGDYVISGLMMRQQHSVKFLIAYKEGMYEAIMIDWINDVPTSEAELFAKYQTALFFYECDNHKYDELVIDASNRFLEYYQQFAQTTRWEMSCHINSLQHLEIGYRSYRAWAIHFLSGKDKDHVKEIVSGWFNNKLFIGFDVLYMLHYHLKDEALPYFPLALEGNNGGGTEYYRQTINLLTTVYKPEQYLSMLWKLVSAKSKTVRELVAKIVAEKDAEAETKAVELLKSKTTDVRQTAAFILSFFNSEEAMAAVKDLLDKETNDNTRDLYLQITKEQLPQRSDEEFRSQLVTSASARNKLNKPAESWLMEEELPPLFYVSGTILTKEEVRFLFYRMSRAKGMRSDVEAKYLLDAIDKEKSAPFAMHILKTYSDKGAKPEHKYLLALAAILGNDDVVDKIRLMINRWIDEARVKMAEYGIGALALQGSDKALRWVEWYSRKYKTKKANVGVAALRALEDAADEQGITIHELGDRVVPDFGFDGLFKTFTVGNDEYRAFIDASFKLCFFNEDNKKLKALPSATPQTLKEEFKLIGKEVRDIVRSQSGRMEYYLLMQRKWSVESWKQFFLNNPVMFIYATKLLWGIYSKEGRLIKPFLCLEDTSLVDVNDDEIEIEEGLQVGIVHPLDLSEAQRESWKRKFFDAAIESIFPQLERPVHAFSPQDAERKIIPDFAGKETLAGMIKATLERFGWKKGDGADGGFIDSFSLESGSEKLRALLEVEGVFVGGFGYDHEPKLGRLYFIDHKKEKSRWFQFPKDEKDERLVALKNVPPVFYSEVMYNVGSIRLKREDLKIDEV